MSIIAGDFTGLIKALLDLGCEDFNNIVLTCRPTIPVLRDGYIQWIEPAYTNEAERYQMFGDHGNFTPVKFNDAF